MKKSAPLIIISVVLLVLSACSGGDHGDMSMNGGMDNGDPETISANLFARTELAATSEETEPFAVGDYSWEFDDNDTFNDVLGVE